MVGQLEGAYKNNQRALPDGLLKEKKGEVGGVVLLAEKLLERLGGQERRARQLRGVAKEHLEQVSRA